MSKHTKVPLSKCPICKYKLDCATCVSKPDELPRAGDATICIKCGEFLMFTEGLGLRLPTEQEYQEVGTNPRIIAAQVIVRGCAGRPDHLKWPKQERRPRGRRSF